MITVKTNNGLEVRIVSTNGSGSFPLIGLIVIGGEDMAFTWTRGGKWGKEVSLNGNVEPSKLDLDMKTWQETKTDKGQAA